MDCWLLVFTDVYFVLFGVLICLTCVVALFYLFRLLVDCFVCLLFTVVFWFCLYGFDLFRWLFTDCGCCLLGLAGLVFLLIVDVWFIRFAYISLYCC